MNNTFKNIIAISLTAMSISGCATLSQNKSYKVEKINSEKVNIGYVSEQSDKDKGTFIRGKVARRFSNQGKVGGHIYIDMISPNGNKIFQKIVNPRRSKPRSLHSKFYAHMNKSIPKESVIRVKHDNENH